MTSKDIIITYKHSGVFEPDYPEIVYCKTCGTVEYKKSDDDVNKHCPDRSITLSSKYLTGGVLCVDGKFLPITSNGEGCRVPKEITIICKFDNGEKQ